MSLIPEIGPMDSANGYNSSSAIKPKKIILTPKLGRTSMINSTKLKCNLRT
jgi:hypothetical protein